MVILEVVSKLAFGFQRRMVASFPAKAIIPAWSLIGYGSKRKHTSVFLGFNWIAQHSAQNIMQRSYR